MESSIDPSIRDRSRFPDSIDGPEFPKDDGGKFNHENSDQNQPSDKSHQGNGDNSADSHIDNVFTLNEYMNNHQADTDMENDETAQAALNMMNFSGDEEPVDDSSMDRMSIEPPNFRPGTKPELPKQITTVANGDSMQMVEYDHHSRPQRLGRPRNHVLKNVKIAPKDSAQNETNSKYMLYRLDDQPLDGPGSRGGKGEIRKQKGKITSEAFRKRKQKQSQLIFSVHGLGINNGEKDGKSEKNENVKEEEPEVVEVEKDGNKVPEESLASDSSKGSEDRKSSKSKNSDSKSLKPPKKKPAKQSVQPLKQSISRTTVLNGRHKVTRQFPGPLIPLYYDIYDENFMNSSQNIDCNKEILALGFPVKKVNHGMDIVYITSFCSKFFDVLGIGKLGPQDIEEGLGLDGSSDDNDPSEVSPLMNKLFARLLTLVLNRKSEVNPKFQGKAISELKPLVSTLRLPREWKDNNEAYERFVLDQVNAVPVDNSKPDILLEEGYTFHPSAIYENPFNDKQGFEKLGLPGIRDPHDRLTMLRTLVDWCLSTSNDVRTAISDILSKQDIPGDKETYYGARAVLKGFKHTDNLSQDTSKKMQKKGYSDDNDVVQKYFDPVSDPLQHPLRLRLDEQVVGDLGFHIGRFYLCRTSDVEDGGLSSVKTMEQIRSNPTQIKTSYAARFKLYVQDTYKLLVEGLSKEGVEFSENGEEVIRSSNQDDLPDGHFYEVASTTDEMEAFVTHLSKRLGVVLEDSVNTAIISSTSAIYKPTTALYEYLSGLLPLFREQDALRIDSRPSRKRNIDYNEASASKKYRLIEDDFDVEFDASPMDGAYDDELEIPEDDEDDDYTE